jgi:hypothetical protein
MKGLQFLAETIPEHTPIPGEFPAPPLLSGPNSTYLQTFLGGEELRDGEIFGGISIPLNDPEIVAMSGRQESLASFRERFLNARLKERLRFL